MIGQNVIVKFETSWNPFETFSTVEVVFFSPIPQGKKLVTAPRRSLLDARMLTAGHALVGCLFTSIPCNDLQEGL